MSSVKTEEGHDEAEIQEHTAKMAEMSMPQRPQLEKPENTICMNSYYCYSSYAISLNDIETYPRGTLFKMYWPVKHIGSHLLVKTPTQSIQRPKSPSPDAAPSTSSRPPSHQPTTQAKAAPAKNRTQAK